MKTKEKREIPLIRSPHPREVPDTTAGVHSISINPSRSFMATGGLNVNDLALYTLPDYQPYAIGEVSVNKCPELIFLFCPALESYQR